MVDLPQDHPWSSYRTNAGIERSAWLTPHDEYLRLGKSEGERSRAYRELVATALGDEELASIRNHANRNRVLGDERFQRGIATLVGRRVHIVPPGRPWPAREGPTRSGGRSL